MAPAVMPSSHARWMPALGGWSALLGRTRLQGEPVVVRARRASEGSPWVPHSLEVTLGAQPSLVEHKKDQIRNVNNPCPILLVGTRHVHDVVTPRRAAIRLEREVRANRRQPPVSEGFARREGESLSSDMYGCTPTHQGPSGITALLQAFSCGASVRKSVLGPKALQRRVITGKDGVGFKEEEFLRPPGQRW
jgi:hypothetical protein